ncbi:hypothetical protein ACOMHN_017812 [Nucella lapillus]
MGGKTSRQPSPLAATTGVGEEDEEEGVGGVGSSGRVAKVTGREGPYSSNQPTSDSSSSTARPTPYIEAPYVGPWAEYQFLDVTVPVQSDVTFSFCDVTMTSTRSSSVLPALTGVYGQGYSLVNFCRVPGGGGGGGQKRVFSAGKELRYQGIFCRYEGDPGNDGWNLCEEKSILHTHNVTPGVIATEEGPGAQHIQQMISTRAKTGARLLTVQWSGQPQQSAPEAGFGVDVFFEVPDQPLPERSVYQLVTASATLVKRSLFTSKCHVVCDWTGILTRHLARGWRLVDIFCEVLLPGSTLSSSSSKIQTVWFFEKPESRARDESAAYEGTVVEHWIDFVGSSSSSSSIMSRGASGCLGGGKGAGKRGGGCAGKKNSGRRSASLRKKTPDEASNTEPLKSGTQDPERESDNSSEKNTPGFKEEHQSLNQQNAETYNPHQTIPSGSQPHTDSAGWEGVIRSMGEKGWELASVVNTMESQVVSGKPKIKMLLVFQRRLSLAGPGNRRRTSDGLTLRADGTGGCSSTLGDLPLLTGETTSHLNPSLAVRLPLSRTASREQDDFHTGCTVDDDLPSTIGGPAYSTTASTTELSTSGRASDGGWLEPGRGSRRGREERLLQPKTSIGDGEGSVGTGGRSSTSSQHSRVTAAEVHTPVTGEESSDDGKPPRHRGSGKRSSENPQADKKNQQDTIKEKEKIDDEHLGKDELGNKKQKSTDR